MVLVRGADRVAQGPETVERASTAASTKVDRRLPSLLVPLFCCHLPVLEGLRRLFIEDGFLHVRAHL